MDNPVRLYAVTKKSNELMAHAYSKFYDILVTRLRFFTDKLCVGKTIQIFNYGNCRRDFTYIDDIVEGIVRIMRHAPERKNGEDDFRAGVLPEDYDFEAHKELVPMQPGDVPVTYADTTPLEEDFGFKPSTSLREGLRRFAEWYAKYQSRTNIK